MIINDEIKRVFGSISCWIILVIALLAILILTINWHPCYGHYANYSGNIFAFSLFGHCICNYSVSIACSAAKSSILFYIEYLWRFHRICCLPLNYFCIPLKFCSIFEKPPSNFSQCQMMFCHMHWPVQKFRYFTFNFKGCIDFPRLIDLFIDNHEPNWS